jgi:isoleucyl-tRNA synthetase
MSELFSPVAGQLDLPALEHGAIERWREGKVFDRSVAQREGAPEWVFYEGPPTANGRPGTHHVWARVYKDLYPRFHTMRGRHVLRKGGWDCHGLPVELEVEKELGFSGKAQIEEYGIEAFNALCRRSVHRYVDEFAELTERIGMWIDTADAYWTLSNTFIESVWWLFRQMWDKGLIYEGFKVVPYCGRCGTALSSHEVALGYQDVTEASAYVRFPVLDADFDLVVWTTTPWTLISNVAAAVGPGIEYVRVRQPGQRDVVVAAARVAAVLGEDAEVVGPVAVGDLVGRRYERPFDLVPIPDGANRVVAADFVTTEDGTGIVHLAPAFGEVDREVGMREGLPVLNPVDLTARFSEVVTPYAGRFVKDADAQIIEDLAAAGRLLAAVDHTHSYPHCWRCGTALVYYAKTSWFARTSSRKADLLRENETVGWHPETIKHGRFGDWLENNVDWALSRDRFWGTPVPVWRCDDCKREACVGSVAELSERAGRDLAALDLHRPFVDEVTFPCAEEGCSGTARRIDAVLDAWFDSGSMPSAQLHFPFEHADDFDARFPADFICEAIDQTRGWFYSLLAVNTLVFDRTPYRNVVCLAHIVDKDGAKMSKSKGNVIDPWTLIESKGADALRWYFFSAGSPWTPRRVFLEGIDETTRTTLLTFWNTYSFFVTYANLDGWRPPADGAAPVPSDHVLDRWLRSRLHSTVRRVTEALDDFDALGAAQALAGLVDDTSNWWVRRSRDRFWKGASGPGGGGDAAHRTLYEVLRTTAELLAPFTPFLADEVWRNLVGATDAETSVHLTDWPAVDAAAVDPALEDAMALARRFVVLGRAARTDAKIRTRQPLRQAFVFASTGERVDEALRAVVADELNVHAIEELVSFDGLLDWTVLPNFRALGPKLGKRTPRVKELLAAVDGADVQRALTERGVYVLDVDGEPVELTPADVEIRAEAHAELALAQDGPYHVALDLALDDDLRAEGFARELVRAVNDLRKATGLEIADRIALGLFLDGQPGAWAARHAAAIAAEVLATSWTVGALAGAPADAHRLTVDGVDVAVTIAKA